MLTARLAQGYLTDCQHLPVPIEEREKAKHTTKTVFSVTKTFGFKFMALVAKTLSIHVYLEGVKRVEPQNASLPGKIHSRDRGQHS